MNLRTIFLWTMIGSLTCAAALGVVAILMPDLISADEELLSSSLLFGAFSLLALACAMVIGKQRLVGVMWSGIAASAVALTCWLLLIWLPNRAWSSMGIDDDIPVKTGALATIYTLWATHLGVLSLLRIARQRFVLVRTATLIDTSLLAAVASFAILVEEFDDGIVRTLGVLGILGSCGTAVTPILALIEWLGHRSEATSMPEHVRVTLTCPRCQSSEQLRPGRASKCSKCGLRIELHVEEPRCSCGYLLYRLRDDRCPECGKQIPSDDTWAGGVEHDSAERGAGSVPGEPNSD